MELPEFSEAARRCKHQVHVPLRASHSVRSLECTVRALFLRLSVRVQVRRELESARERDGERGGRVSQRTPKMIKSVHQFLHQESSWTPRSHTTREARIGRNGTRYWPTHLFSARMGKPSLVSSFCQPATSSGDLYALSSFMIQLVCCSAASVALSCISSCQTSPVVVRVEGGQCWLLALCSA